MQLLRNELLLLIRTLTVKTASSVARRFIDELTIAVSQLWADGTPLTANMRGLLRDYIDEAYTEGYAQAGGDIDAMTANDERIIEDLTDEQDLYVAQFVKDSKAAKTDEEKTKILQRITLWGEGILAAGQRGWIEYQATQEAYIQWHTANDDLTCPICAPLNNIVVKAGESFGDNGQGQPVYNEPAHPYCRCTTSRYIPDPRQRIVSGRRYD
jgi:hypothetical protein